MTAKALPPEQAHELLLSQHASIRRLLEDVEAAAAATLDVPDPSGPAEALRTAAIWLRESLLAHMESEEALLAPFLEASADGQARLGVLKTEHASQRALLDQLAHTASSRDEPDVLAWRVQGLARDLLADMAVEENELFARVLPPVAAQLQRTRA